jgi:hypothetical protein
MRDWKKFENDEIMTIWKGYIAQDFSNGDPLRMKYYVEKPIRLTPIEICQLVEDLMRRLDIKENGEPPKEQSIHGY